MSEDIGFEPVDHELGRRLRTAAPTVDDTDSTLAALRPRLRRARLRHRVATSGASALAVAAVVVLALVVFEPSGGTGVHVPPASRQKGSTTTTESTIPAPTTGTTPLTTPESTPPVTSSPATTPNSAPPATIDDHGGNRGPGSDNSGPGSASSGPGSGGTPEIED
jgi:hypothetical protein